MKKLISVILMTLFLGLLPSFTQEKEEKAEEPLKPALIIIDIQNQYLTWVPEQEKNVGLYFINAYIDMFRENDLPIIRVYHTNPETGPSPDSEEFQYPDFVKIEDEDPMIIKNYKNSFKKTELEKMLNEKECNVLFLCGMSSVSCVIATYFGAKDLDFKTFMLKNAIMCHNSEFTEDIEVIFDALSYDAAEIIVKQAGK